MEDKKFPVVLTGYFPQFALYKRLFFVWKARRRKVHASSGDSSKEPHSSSPPRLRSNNHSVFREPKQRNALASMLFLFLCFDSGFGCFSSPPLSPTVRTTNLVAFECVMVLMYPIKRPLVIRLPNPRLGNVVCQLKEVSKPHSAQSDRSTFRRSAENWNPLFHNPNGTCIVITWILVPLCQPTEKRHQKCFNDAIPVISAQFFHFPHHFPQ